MLVGVAAEVAYLLFVPDSRWYESRLSKKFDDDVVARRKAIKDKIIPTLRTDVQQRYFRLEGVRSQITTQSQDEAQWFREVLRKLDYLLEKFLLFASKETQFRNYLTSLHLDLDRSTSVGFSSASSQYHYDFRPSAAEGSNRRVHGKRQLQDDPPKRKLNETSSTDGVEIVQDRDSQEIQVLVSEVQQYYSKERESVEAQFASEQDEDTKAIVSKRADVLQRRQEYAGKIGKILGNLNHQLRLVEETFGLINDEIRARSPEQILADIEEVVVATQSMTDTLEELAPYEQMASRLAE